MCRPLLSLSLLIALVSALLASFSHGAAAQEPLPADTTILRLIGERVDARQAGGIMVGVLEPDGSTCVLAYGDAGPGAQPLDARSVFEIGSITKVFTATLLAEMAARGEVGLDDPVRTYLPAGRAMPSRNGEEITLRHLATHTSGLPRLPTNLAPADMTNPYADYTAEKLYDFLSSYALPREPGERYEYSNLGAGLLGHVLALRAGMSFEELVAERIQRPLGMERTGITLTSEMRRRMVRGHSASGQVVPYWDLPALAGAGALRSSVEDLLRFAAANLAPTGSRLGEVMAQTHRLHAPAGQGPTQIALGWHLTRAFDREILWHNGGTGGFHSFLGLDRERRVAVVVLANAAISNDDLGFHLLDPRMPLQPVRRGTAALHPDPPAFSATSRYSLTQSVPSEKLCARIGLSRLPVR